MTNSKFYTSIDRHSSQEWFDTECSVKSFLDELIDTDKCGEGVNAVTFSIRSEDGECWEELFSYDNKNSSADFSQRAKEVLSAETINRISNFGKEVSHPKGIPYSVRQEFPFAFREAKRRVELVKFSPNEGDENYICREEGFEIPYFDGTLHFSKEEFDENYHDEKDRDQFPKYSPYFVLSNGVHIFYAEQVFAFDKNRWLIDWPE